MNVQAATNPNGPIQAGLYNPAAEAKFRSIFPFTRTYTILPDPNLDTKSEIHSGDRRVQQMYQMGIKGGEVVPGAPHEYLAEYWRTMPKIRKILEDYLIEFNKAKNSRAMVTQNHVAVNAFHITGVQMDYLRRVYHLDDESVSKLRNDIPDLVAGYLEQGPRLLMTRSFGHIPFEWLLNLTRDVTLFNRDSQLTGYVF